MTDRELGSETVPCPNCGADLAIAENPDGSTSPVNCDTCWPSEPTEKADDQSTPDRTYGTDQAAQQVAADEDAVDDGH